MSRLITRTHVRGDAPSTAIYSPCERYRYTLSRVWDTAGLQLLFVMLNPSTATEARNDPTIERCERRARALGYGGFCAANIFAWRETDPAALRRVADPVGPENDAMLADCAARADAVIAAWGVHGAHRDRGAAVAALLRATGRPLLHLGLSKHGHPRHPLYIAYAREPAPWAVTDR